MESTNSDLLKKKEEIEIELYLKRADDLLKSQKPEEAQELLQRAIKDIPSQPPLLKKFEEVKAIVKKKQLSTLSPAQLAKEEGNEHYKESRYDKAIDCYTRAINLSKDEKERAIFYSNRAACYQQLQMYSEVVTDCNLCLETHPDNVKALIRRGLAFENRENWKMARVDMAAALALDPSARQASEALVRLDRNLKMDANLKSKK